MRKEEILKKIGAIINDLKDQHQYLTDTNDYNDLELELFTANSDFLIDHIQILKKLKDTKYFRTSVIEAEPIASKINLPKNKATETNEVELPTPFLTETVKPAFDFAKEPNEKKFDFEQNVPTENIFDRELTPQETEVLQSKQVFLEKLNEEHRENFKDTLQSAVVNDEFLTQNIEINQTSKVIEETEISPTLVFLSNQEIEPLPQNICDVSNIEGNINSTSQPLTAEDKKILQVTETKKQTLNEFLSNQNNVQNISSRLSNLTITDLKSVISLNDKMMFIKELFQGYNLAYSEAIEILNRFDAFESADNFLQKNYAIKNKWVDKQDVVDRFYEILNRRFLR